MRKLLLIVSTLLLFATGALYAQFPCASSGPVSPNLGLNTPSFNTPNWNTPMNANFICLDNYLSGATGLPGLKVNSFTDIIEIATPSNPASNYERWFASNSTHQLSCVTSSGGNCAPSGTGGLTSVGLSTTATWLTVGNSPLIANGTITLNPTGGQGANLFLATPNGSTGIVSLRAIVAADIPTLNQSTTGSAATANTLNGCTPATAGTVNVWNGSAWTCFAGNTSGTASFQENASGIPSWGSGAATSFNVNGTPLSSATTVNFQNSAAFNGLTATFANPSVGNVQLGFSGTLGNAGLTNSTIGVNGTTNQIVSSTSTPALGGSTTLTIANPFTFPGKAILFTPTTGSASLNAPSGSAPTTPVNGDIWNLSGILQFYDGTHTNSLTTIQGAVSNGQCAQFSGTAGLMIGVTCTAAGTVTSFSSSNLNPLFTTSVTNATTTPALSFALSNANAFTVYGNPTNSSAAPLFTGAPAVTSITLEGATSGSATISATATGSTLSLGPSITTGGDYGGSPLVPPAAVMAITDTSTTTTDNTFDLSCNVPATSYHQCLYAGIDGFAQLQVGVPGVATSAHVGGVVIGSAIAMGSLSTSPPNKLWIVNSSAAQGGITIVQTSAAATGTMLRMNNATASGTGFNFMTACAGGVAADGTCSGANVASLNGAGLFTGSFSGAHNGTVGATTPAAGTFSALADTAMTGGPFCVHETSGVLSATASDCGAGGGISGLTTGVIPQAGSATTIVNSSPQLDNGVTTANTLTYAGSGGIAITSSVAGVVGLGQGTAAGTITNAVGLAGPTTVPTAYNDVFPSAAASGYLKFSTSVNQTGCTASATNMCGQYVSAISLATDVTGVLPLANMAQVPFDSQTNDLTTPTGDASFTFPAAATNGFTLSGTAPATSSGASGTNAQPLLTINGVIGGADSNATGVAGNGSTPSITAGNGGAGTGTNTKGGSGGGINLTTGNGGASLGTGANPNGGNFTITLGKAGIGGSGAAGATGQFNIVGTSIASSSGAAGLAAGTIFLVSGLTGGATSNAAGTAGVGSIVTINSGTGGAGTGTNAVGGAGGAININAGSGGASLGTGANANGGNIVLTPGSPGTGGSGTAGQSGVVQIGGTAPFPIIGTSGGMMWGCGTAPTGIAGNDAFYCDAANQPHLLSGITDLGIVSAQNQTVQITGADWTCGTGGTNTSCVAAQTISTLTFTLPLEVKNWTFDCNLVVGQATAATANSWNFQTATNGATNVTASYSMNTAATAMTGGATTDTASTTTTTVIGPTWTLGGTATKMPVHIWGTVEGASASGTVLNIQLVAPTVADLVTIYRGSSCRIY